jgi:hypothetical protein
MSLLARTWLLPTFLAGGLAGCPSGHGNDTGAFTDEDWDGFSLVSDCNDADPLVNPDADEVCDGIDNDCDGDIDDDPADIGAFYVDADGDGAGDAAKSVITCTEPKGYVLNDLDCDDSNDEIRPGLAELCDDRDNDCDGDVDEEAVDALYWYADFDGDLYGNAQSGTVLQCDPPSGYVATPTDCDDTDATINPDGIEICDAKVIEGVAHTDENCDGVADDDDPTVTATTTFYEDRDDDGHGDPATSVEACLQPEGYAALGDDCDDTQTAVHPGSAELCGDGLDNDCDSVIDEPGDDAPTSWWADSDGDGYGDDGDPFGSLSCDDPGGQASNDDDCDDGDVAVHPGASETWYDDVDSDCAGDDDFDQDADGVEAETWGADCDDTNATIFPGAPETCANGGDDDCDGVSDECKALGWIYGDDLSDEAGTSVAAPGDVSGDGVGDVLIGADLHDGVGAFYILEGPVTGSAAIGGVATPVVGITALDWLGRSVAGAGDVDGDGTSDFLVGAPGVDDGGADAGAAYLFLGPTDPTWSTIDDADLAMQGEAPDDLAGWSVSGAGDLTDDGQIDLVVGAVGRTTGGPDGGALYVVSGDERGTLDLVFAEARVLGTDGGDWAGHAVADAGDLDGDGIADLLVGAPYADGAESFSGVAYLFYGPITGTLDASDADATRYGDLAGDQAGFAVAGAGDCDDDGLRDLLVGAPEDDANGSGSGAAYLFLSPVSGSAALSSADARFEGTAPGDNAGSAFAGDADFDGDGRADVVVGAPFDDSVESDAGGVYAFRAPLSGVSTFDDADAQSWGAIGDSRFGASVAVLRDTNGDGGDDLVVGAPTDAQTGSETGAVDFLSFAETP